MANGAKSSAKFQRVNKPAMSLLNKIRGVFTGAPGKAVGAAMGDSLINMHKPKARRKK